MNVIMHIGAGKTGTTSIQKTFRENIKGLKDQGFLYCGLNFEELSSKQFKWQTPGGFHSIFREGEGEWQRQLSTVLNTAKREAESLNCHSIIWSNESLFNSKRMANFIENLNGDNYKIIAYVRRHDKWIQSAYEQWGIKHKTYKNRIKPFGQWVKTFDTSFTEHISNWKRVNAELYVRNFDAVDDVVRDVSEVLGISVNAFRMLHRDNEKLSREELKLRLIFNDQFPDPVLKREFDTYLPSSAQRDEAFLEQYFPTEEQINSILSDTQDDRQELNKMLPDDQLFEGLYAADVIKANELSAPKAISLLLGINAKLAARVHCLERSIKELTDKLNKN